jgi:CheY-specific phosphatase CheX
MPTRLVLNQFWYALEEILQGEGWAFRRRTLTATSPLNMPRQVLFLMGLTGDLTGTVQWRMYDKTALALGTKLAGGSAPLDEVHISALTEILNMVLARTLMRLERHSITGRLTPPVMLLGNPDILVPGHQVYHMPLEVEGQLTVLSFALRLAATGAVNAVASAGAVGIMAAE